MQILHCSYKPYKVFDYSANFDADKDFIDEMVKLNGDTCSNVGMLDDVAISCPDCNLMGERINAAKRHALMVLHRNFEPSNHSFVVTDEHKVVEHEVSISVLPWKASKASNDKINDLALVLTISQQPNQLQLSFMNVNTKPKEIGCQASVGRQNSQKSRNQLVG